MEKEEFDAWMEAYEAVKAEMPTESGSRYIHRLRTAEVVDQIDSMNPSALFLGADPKTNEAVTVDIDQNNLGAILITADSQEDRIDLVTSMATGLRLLQQPEEVSYGLMTKDKKRWDIPKTPHQVGFYAYYENGASDFVLSIASWAHSKKKNKQRVFLFVDNLFEAVEGSEFDTNQNLRWLLLRGPARGVYPVVTMDPKTKYDIAPWLDVFGTNIDKTGKDTFRLSVRGNSLDFTKTT